MTKTIYNKAVSICMLTLLMLFTNCSDSKEALEPFNPEPPATDNSFILTKNEFNVSSELTKLTTTFKTTVSLKDIEIENNASSWCQVEIQEPETIYFEIHPNPSGQPRSTTVLLLLNQKELTSIKINQKGAQIDYTIGDIKVTPIKATATNEEKSTNGEYSPANMLDNNFNTRFNSRFSDFNNWPFELGFEFKGENRIDYITHHPRQDGDNKGIIEKVTLYVSTLEKPELTKVGEYDWTGHKQYSTITFPEPYINVQKFLFKVHSAIGKRVSCAEMEFFEKSDNTEIPLFTDKSCSELKEGITKQDIEACSDQTLKLIATALLDENYDKIFRIQEYRPYQHPDVMANVTSSKPKSLRDNATGIYVDDLSEKLIVCVGENNVEGLTLIINNLDQVKSDIHPLREGINILEPNLQGHIYIYNHTNEAIPLHPKKSEQQLLKDKSVKIHIVSGKVNGYFDIQKHDSSLWREILKGEKYGTSRDIDILGKYTHIVWGLSDYRKYNTNIETMIGLFDEAIYAQMKFLGLEKHNKLFNNRYFIHTLYPLIEGVGAYATDYRTAYNYNGYSTVFCTEKGFRDRNWVIGHEVGHTNQITPGLKWQGCTEVTNNITALLNHQIVSGGTTMKLINDGHYTSAHDFLIQNNRSWFYQDGQGLYNRVMEKLVPFWQLKLYFHDAQGMTDFYPDIAEHARTTNYDKLLERHKGSSKDGLIMLDFVRTACHTSDTVSLSV